MKEHFYEEYSYESSVDIEEDIRYSLDELGEFEGTITVQIFYNEVG